MNTLERRHEIVELALAEGRVLVNELSDCFGVSEVTIRGDLNFLNAKGLLTRSRGGAVASSPLAEELALTDKKSENIKVKRKIAQAAVDLISPGESIILDSGSTTAEIASQIRLMRNLVVMTNGLNVAQNLSSAEGIDVLLTGGKLRKKSLSFYGRFAEESLRHLHFDKLFLGVDGFDLEVGITTHFEYEAILNRMMCSAAKQIIAVTDSSKFNRSSMHKIASISQIDTLITDQNIPDTFAQNIEGEGVRIIIT